MEETLCELKLGSTPPLHKGQLGAFTVWTYPLWSTKTQGREGSSLPSCQQNRKETDSLRESVPLPSSRPPSFALNRRSMSRVASNQTGMGWAITWAPIPFSHDGNDLRRMGLMAVGRSAETIGALNVTYVLLSLLDTPQL